MHFLSRFATAEGEALRYIQWAIEKIEQTALGGVPMKYLLSRGWVFTYGWAAGGAGFTFPLIRRVHIKPGLDASRTLAVMTHEVWHAYLYGGQFAASIEQEYVVESHAIRLRAELGVPNMAAAQAMFEAWFATPVDAKYQEIRRLTAWHYKRLPVDQPSGLRALYWAMQQAIHIRELRDKCPAFR